LDFKECFSISTAIKQ